MKTRGNPFLPSSLVLSAITALFSAPSASAASLTWGAGGAGGAGTWDVNTTANWWDGLGDVQWPALGGTDDDAVFAGTAGTVSLAPGGVTVNDLTFNTSGYLIQSNTLTLNGAATSKITVDSGLSATITSIIAGAGFSKEGAGTLTLNAQNTYSGSTRISAGTLVLGNALALENSTLDTTNSIAGDASNGLKTTVTTPTLGGLSGNKDLASVFTTNAGGYSTVTTLTLNPGAAVSNDYSAVIANGAAAMNLTKTGAGTQTLSGASTYGGITRVSAGTLKIASGGSFTTTIVNNTSLSVGNVAGNSLLHIQSGGAGTASRLQVGTVNGGIGAIYNQGTLTVNGTANLGNFALGYVTGAYGYYRHDTSTTTSVNEIGIGSTNNSTTGVVGGNGVMDVLQGKVAPVSTAVNGGWFAMNRGNTTQYSQLNISGGTFELPNSPTRVGLFLSSTTTHNSKGGQAVINVSGNGSLTSAGTTTELDLMSVVTASATSMVGVLNIGSGGTVQTNVVKATNANGTALVNFHGGTLKANNTGVTLMGGSNIDGAYIYSGGAIVDTNGKDVTISQNLLTPTGDGVSSIPVTANGTGYIGRPVVYLTGGGGTGATAVADFNPTTGEVTGITITNPGTGYTSAPTVTITGGGGTAPTLGTVTLASNTSGGLTKSGAGTLSLTAANSYSGDTTVSEGTLSLGDATNNTSLADTAKVLVASGTTLNLNYLVGNTDTVKELWLGGVQQNAGVYGASDPSGLITGSGTLTVTNGPTPSDPFVAWISAPPYNLTGPNATFDSDYDNDGVDNGLEWIFGGDPTQNDNPSILPAVTGNAATGLTLVFNRAADSLPPASTLVIDFDSDLDATWAKSVTVGAASSGPDANGVTVAVDTPSAGKVTVNIPATNASNGRLFARFRAEKP